MPPPAPPSQPSGATLTPEGFADAFIGASRTLWCVAAGVLGTGDAADDVLQDAAMIALQKLDQFTPGTSFTAWMARIVRNVALNTGRHRQRRRIRDAGADALRGVTAPAPLRSPPALPGGLGADPSLFDDDVASALLALDDIPRSCLLLRTVLDLPYREIAHLLDIPEGTAMSHVHRSRAAMRARLATEAAEART